MTSYGPGLCAHCAHCAIVRSSRGSTFYRCRSPGRTKYPSIPVLRCDAYSSQTTPLPEGRAHAKELARQDSLEMEVEDHL